MSLQVSRLSDELQFGIVIHGLSPEDVGQTSIAEELRRLWIQHGLLLFRETDDSPEFQIELSRCFGPLENHPVREIWVEGYPELISLVARPESGSIVSIDGRQFAGWIPWHLDTVYTTRLNRGGLLRVVQSTSWGGETGFVDRMEAYDTLPERLKTQIEGKEIAHQLEALGDAAVSKRRNVEVIRYRGSTTALKSRSKEDFPPVAHPAVFLQPETGRPTLNLSPLFSQYVVGMDRAESDALLEELRDHIAACPSYHHKWESGDMILWDNWRMAHCVSGAPVDEVRIMRRTTIGGDYRLGRSLMNESCQ